MLVECMKPFNGGHGDEILPQVRTVYRVREVANTPFAGAKRTVGVRLVEIVNRPRWYLGGFYECLFDPTHFRPLSGDRLAIFRQHLTDVPSKTKEPA